MRYVVLGAGQQGTAAAYDLCRFGRASEVLLLDKDAEQARRAANRINRLIGAKPAVHGHIDVSDQRSLTKALQGATVCLSAVPYYFNVEIAQACIQVQAHFCDLGGNLDVVFRELELDAAAKRNSVALVPDCGLAPGLANILAAQAVARMETCREVRIYCGGLPQVPRPPLAYKLVFNIEGLTNEYTGDAYVLREGKVRALSTFTELESVEFAPPVGRCEAFITSGGASTCPWTYQGKLATYEYKTVRYPGHYDRMKAMLDLGLLDREPIEIGDGTRVAPRDVFHRVAARSLDFPAEPDLVVLRVIARGTSGQEPVEIVYDMIDFYDPETGFSAMERATGYPAAIVAILLAENKIAPGVRPPERAVPSSFSTELCRRQIEVFETVRRPLPRTASSRSRGESA